MDIQSIYSSRKGTAPTATPADEDQAPATGFSALLEMVGSQFKATLGIGMDPVVIKTDVVEEVRAPETRDTKPRAERADDRDAKAKPAKDETESDDAQADEAAAADDENAAAADAGTQTETGQQQEAAQAVVAAAVNAALIAQTVATGPVVAAEVVTEVAAETVVAEVEAVVTDVAAIDATVKTAETVVDVKAAVQTTVQTTEKVVAPEAVVKDPARVQQAISAYAPAQETEELAAVAVETDVAATETKVATKDNAAKTLEVRSAAAQEQANNLARLLGSENRIQVQVNVNAAQTAKQTVADVSIYNIYAGYSAADAISLANGQFGQAEELPAQPQPQAQVQPSAPRAMESLAQVAVQAQAHAQAPLPASSNAASPQASRPEAASTLSTLAVQASASSGGASNTNLGFSAFAQGGQSNAAGQTQQAAPANPTDRPAATAQHVIDQIKVNITKAAKAGLDRVTIQLKPVELGRIEIKLEMSEDHKVRVTVTADSKDTLSLLQTDARALERTLNDAGLRTDANNLHFNLRSDTDAQSADGQNGRGTGKQGADGHAETTDDTDDINYDYAAAANARGGVDTFA